MTVTLGIHSSVLLVWYMFNYRLQYRNLSRDIHTFIIFLSKGLGFKKCNFVSWPIHQEYYTDLSSSSFSTDTEQAFSFLSSVDPKLLRLPNFIATLYRPAAKNSFGSCCSTLTLTEESTNHASLFLFCWTSERHWCVE